MTTKRRTVKVFGDNVTVEIGLTGEGKYECRANSHSTSYPSRCYGVGYGETEDEAANEYKRDCLRLDRQENEGRKVSIDEIEKWW